MMMRDLFPVSANEFLYPDNAFDNFFNGLFQPNPTTQIKLPKVDIQDADDAYIVTADLPGMTKEDINITYDNEVLTIAAQHNQENEENDEQKRYIRRERINNAFKRQFVVRNIQKEGISAEFTNGVLTIRLAKADPELVAASHRIDIK
jgi:HSP20 family protein